MITKRPSTTKDQVVVTFEIPGSIWANQIHLVGDFNSWDRESLPFRLTRQGSWLVELELEHGSEYRFRYLIDGDQWRSEWHSDHHAAAADAGIDCIVIAQLPQAA